VTLHFIFRSAQAFEGKLPLNPSTQFLKVPGFRTRNKATNSASYKIETYLTK
jgi:hypothetical protein